MNTKYYQCGTMLIEEKVDFYGTNSNGRRKILCQDQKQKRS